MMTQNPKRKKKHDDHNDDYLAEEHPGKDHDEAIVDEQGEESFPASDPPANY